MTYIYDIEVYSNLTLIIFKNTKTGEFYKFKISPEGSNIDEFKEFLAQKPLLIGFNNHHYDDRILQFIEYLGFSLSSFDVYNLSQALIEKKVSSGFKAIWNDFCRIKSYDKKFVSIDLKVFQRNISLKKSGLGLEVEKIQELPFDPHKELTPEEMREIEKYCENDIKITEILYKESLPKIEAREMLNDQYKGIKAKLGYKIDFCSLSDSKLAADIMALNYCAKNNLSYWEFIKLIKPDYKVLLVKNLIFSDIMFKTPECQALLEKLKKNVINFKTESIQDYKNKGLFETFVPASNTELKEEVTINGKTYKLGLGGLHSTQKNEVFSGEIIDVDVASYYPNLIVKKGIKPDFLNERWLDIYSELIEQRLDAKKKGKKAKADAFKIIINSLYGNFRYTNFYAYDPKTAYIVTLNGQFYLLMLIEELELNGYEVISANTDGITYIRKGQEGLSDADIFAHWEGLTGFELEKTSYKSYILKDVNNYSAKPLNGAPKRKGIFSHAMLGKGLNADIVGIAVEKCIYKDIPVSETIQNCIDIKAFLYSKEIGKKFKAEIGGEKIQRINRFFISKSMQANKLQRRDNKGKVANIIAKNKVIIANNLDDKCLIDLVDRQHYEDEAKKLLNSLLAKQRTKELVELNMVAVNTFQKQGLVAIPKTYKENLKGLKLKDLPAEFDFKAYPTVAISTGTDVIAIDVDYPERLPEQLKIILKNCGSLRSFVDSKGKYKIFFKIKSKVLKQGSYNKKFGFEILYGKPANVAGAYDYKNDYKYSGVITDMPDEIFKILHRIQSISKPASHKEQTYTILCRNEIDAALQYVREFLRSHCIVFTENESSTSFEKDVCNEDCQVVFRFPCPFSDEHTNPGGNEVFLCLDETNKVFMRCWHLSCSDSLFALQKEVNAGLYECLRKVKQQAGIKIDKPLEEITLEDILNEY